MTTDLSIGKQTTLIVRSTYGSFGPFASQNKARSLSTSEFSYVLNFLEPKDLVLSEKVCYHWAQFIDSTGQWKRQCQILLGISTKIDPKPCLPDPSYKKSFQLFFSSIFGESFYERYLGKVGPVPRIPEEISLKKWNEPDPCDSTTTIGKEYVWIYCPSSIKITHLEGFSLDKPDDPNDPEAPKLIKTGLVGRFLKVPMTINNIAKLFQHPKIGNPSTYAYIWDDILEQHGNKRISAGWICMRKSIIGCNLLFTQQQALAKEKGVIISSLQHRILFNFLERVRSGIYPVSRSIIIHEIIGASVALPQGVQAMGPS